ncbi:hypothetical protein PENTCL1PPCAC_1552, partial [Pristionchus entomophagus]
MPPTGQRRIVLDAILLDGTRMVLENIMNSIIEWDQYMGVWLYSVQGIPQLYFKCAACVRPPVTPLPGCECATLPQRPPIAGCTLSSISVPRTGNGDCCSSLVQ